jgi:uncharacterized membrane protein
MEKRAPSESLSHDRIEALSDLVFGLALSIGAIVLVTQTAPKTSGDVISSLIEFGFSFVVLIRVWTRYTGIMTDLPFDTSLMRNLNLVLLFLVSIEPYLFYLLFGTLGRHPTILLSSDFTTAVYALDLAGLFSVLGVMTYLLAQEEKTQRVPELVRNFQFSANTQIIAALLFLVSADGYFWRVDPAGIPLRFWLWIVALLIGSVERAYVRRHPAPAPASRTPTQPPTISPAAVAPEATLPVGLGRQISLSKAAQHCGPGLSLPAQRRDPLIPLAPAVVLESEPGAVWTQGLKPDTQRRGRAGAADGGAELRRKSPGDLEHVLFFEPQDGPPHRFAEWSVREMAR